MELKTIRLNYEWNIQQLYYVFISKNSVLKKKRVHTNEEKLSDTIGSFVNQGRLKPKLQEISINKVWKDLMGEMVDRYTASLKVTNNRLIILITSGPLKHELAYSKDKLIAKINEKMGDDYIKEIIIR